MEKGNECIVPLWIVWWHNDVSYEEWVDRCGGRAWHGTWKHFAEHMNGIGSSRSGNTGGQGWGWVVGPNDISFKALHVASSESCLIFYNFLALYKIRKIIICVLQIYLCCYISN